jgi:hypothetical protein
MAVPFRILQASPALQKRFACHKSKMTVISCVLLILGACISSAEEPNRADSAPVPVEIGIYLLDVYDLDLKNSSYVAIAFLTFLIEPIDLDPRFGVGIAGIFGAVSSMIVVSSNMPENPYFTMSDQIHFASLAFIFLTIFVSCAVLRLYKLGYEKLSRKVDMASGATLAVLYVAIVGLLSRV